jgi:hypothetical protein
MKMNKVCVPLEEGDLPWYPDLYPNCPYGFKEIENIDEYMSRQEMKRNNVKK